MDEHDKYIDLVINAIGRGRLAVKEICLPTIFNDNAKTYFDVMTNIESYKLINKAPNAAIYSLSDLGLDIHRDGGWLVYLANKDANDKQISENLKWTTKVAKWQSKTYWPVTIIAFISTSIAIYEASNKSELSDTKALLASKSKTVDSLKMELSKVHFEQTKTILKNDTVHSPKK